jgi:thiol-disulfide isomerase/thioredoxin
VPGAIKSKMRSFVLIVFLFLTCMMFGKKLKEGMYRASLTINAEQGIELPFNFEVKYKGRKPLIIIRNAEERITVDEISIKGDSVNFKMPAFDTEFRTVLKGNNLEGVWISHYRTSKNTIAFKATYNESRRFIVPSQSGQAFFEGRWEVTFSPGTDLSAKAIGIFNHLEQTEQITGTFLTETGDYRYLEGVQSGNQLYLSCFDGSHAFLFSAEYNNGIIKNGKFYSGIHWLETWEAKRNPDFNLTGAEWLTTLNNKNEKIKFTFPDLNKKNVSLADPKYAGKPVIVQIMGSWCPNCMDESVYLSDLYQRYSKEGLEIIALAFEKTTDFEKARNQVLRFKQRIGIEYDMLITMQSGKDKASEALPFLNKISAFPTTLFLNRQHQVVKIHTGFSGPATGNEYIHFKVTTENLIEKLLKD